MESESPTVPSVKIDAPATATPAPNNPNQPDTPTASSAVQQSLPKPPLADSRHPAKEAWWTDARKVFLTQILTLLLTPLSVALTFYLTEHYKAPKPRVEYVSETFGYHWDPPATDYLAQITEDPVLSLEIRNALGRML